MNRLRVFGTIALALVVGCGSKTQTPDGGGGTAGAAGTAGTAGTMDAGPEVTLPPATGTPGVWENVTSPEMPASLFTGASGFGVGNIGSSNSQTGTANGCQIPHWRKVAKLSRKIWSF